MQYLELSERTKFQFGELVQGNYTVKEYYSKLKECNKSIGYSEKQLKYTFLSGLSHENQLKVRMDGLLELALDEIVEKLSPEQ